MAKQKQRGKIFVYIKYKRNTKKTNKKIKEYIKLYENNDVSGLLYRCQIACIMFVIEICGGKGSTYYQNLDKILLE